MYRSFRPINSQPPARQAKWVRIVLAFICSWFACALEASAEKPNVLMIVVDDMNDWVGCLGGHPDTKTPHLDRLAAQGMLFRNAHCAAPVCNASRVATLTGRRPGQTGVYDNGALWHRALPDLISIPQHFKANGYQVLGGGKIYHHMPGFNRRSDWHEYFDQVFDGHYQTQLHQGMDVSDFRFPEGYPLNGLPEVKTLSRPPKNPREFDWGPIEKAEKETGDGRLVQWAAETLESMDNQPFFMAVGIYRPHLPFYAPSEYFEAHPRDAINLPEINATDLDDLPPAALKLASQRREDLELIRRTGKYREFIQSYLASITFADAMIGKLVEALETSGKADNTIIVVWSDHGWHLGEKQHLHKFTLWERSTHIPLIAVVPGVTSSGASCDRPVDLVDLFPTLNELCDLPEVQDLDGQSLVPWLTHPDLPKRRPAITSHGAGNHAVRGDRWRYIRYADGSDELYDHWTDPHEWKNLAGDEKLEELKQELADWIPRNDAKPLRRRK